MSPVIPEFARNGHLPPGRYKVTMEQVRERFVEDSRFKDSATRLDRWDGLTKYLALWRAAEDRVAPILDGRSLIKSVWLGGSFISSKVDPGNVDLTVITDGAIVTECTNQGINERLAILKNRTKMKNAFAVAPTVVAYRWFRSPWDLLRGDAQSLAAEREYGLWRGAMDDWWQRARPDGEDKFEPTEETGQWTRGYLEVVP
ncbi:hypothetical protein CS0771_07440 [Catellatospora sp. IY07-71]|uniref:DUF6932 family protein n=1 Tax=Catellatospora sp. IY07-71 TaxID=2728827 RepID=UPI001BB40808|nr:hypothetical protein [Catellatospora sp. IY07-71]BCJ71200.1 hypothetical protein CS0771_07440 [Catellatospora sp. IY07-71]